MKDGYRFVDCDMHIMEPIDLFDKYLDPGFTAALASMALPGPTSKKPILPPSGGIICTRRKRSLRGV